MNRDGGIDVAAFFQTVNNPQGCRLIFGDEVHTSTTSKIQSPFGVRTGLQNHRGKVSMNLLVTHRWLESKSARRLAMNLYLAEF